MLTRTEKKQEYIRIEEDPYEILFGGMTVEEIARQLNMWNRYPTWVFLAFKHISAEPLSKKTIGSHMSPAQLAAWDRAFGLMPSVHANGVVQRLYERGYVPKGWVLAVDHIPPMWNQDGFPTYRFQHPTEGTPLVGRWTPMVH